MPPDRRLGSSRLTTYSPSYSVTSFGGFTPFFANSDIGVMFINRDTMDSSHYNRSIGVDGNFRLNPAMDVNAYIAKTATPGLEGDDFAGRIAYAFTSRSLLRRGAFVNSK